MVFALIVAGVLLLIAAFSIRRQLDNLKRLKRDAHVASDDRRYQTNQARRRIATGCLMIVLAGMLSSAYLTGMDRRAVQLGNDQRPADEKGNKQEMTPEEKAFVRFYAGWWITILVLIFLVVSLSIVDIWSTRRYAWSQIKRISLEHREVLERDLAMYRQQKLNDRMRGAQ